MNYDHSYHAGNFADVFKHLVLVALFERLTLKEKAFCYIDTHSGYPSYRLDSVKALKTKEAAQGIQKLLKLNPPEPLFQKYFSLIEAANPSGVTTLPNVYPGSSTFAALLKRPQDRLMLNEWMAEPYQALKQCFKQDQSIHCHQQEAYLFLNAVLPPKEKRGLIFIDPPYENAQEFENIFLALQKAVPKFPQGIYAIWYPIKDPLRVEGWIKKMQKHFSQEMLNLTCCPWGKDIAQRLSGSGLLILNPPWQLEAALAPIIKTIETCFLTSITNAHIIQSNE